MIPIQFPPAKLGVMAISWTKLGVTVKMVTSKSHGGCILLYTTAICVELFVNRTTNLLTFRGGADYVYISIIQFPHPSIYPVPLCSRRAPVLLLPMIIITSSMAVGPTRSFSGPMPHLPWSGLDFSVLYICYPYPAIFLLSAILLATFDLQLVGVVIAASRPYGRSPSSWIAEQTSTCSANHRYYKTCGAIPVWARIYQEHQQKVSTVTAWEISMTNYPICHYHKGHIT